MTIAAMLLVAACAACGGTTKTKVQLWFDTEDYTWDKSNDAIRDIANLLTEEGVRGHFNTVGYLAKVLKETGRDDVIRAMKPHVIGDQTLYHSLHPTISELSDGKDYEEAYRRVYDYEKQSFDLLKEVFGLKEVILTAHTGPSSTYVGLDVCADLGCTFIGGMGAGFQTEYVKGFDVWYCNMRQIPYNAPRLYLEVFLPEFWDRFHVDYDYELEKYAKFDGIVCSMHPHKAVRKEHWDAKDYNGGNNVEWGRWSKPTERPESETKLFYERLRAFVRRLKNDPRFEFVDCEELQRMQKPRRAITRSDVPALRRALGKRLWPIHEPASWCIADCFQAAVRIFRGEEKFLPSKAYGFLECPHGVDAGIKVKKADLLAAAKRIEFKRHLPASIRVGEDVLGPADFLLAVLEVMDTGGEEVLVEPKDQLGDLRAFSPTMADFTHVGAWGYTPDFRDEYVSNRLRWQFWTMRFE